MINVFSSLNEHDKLLKAAYYLLITDYVILDSLYDHVGKIIRLCHSVAVQSIWCHMILSLMFRGLHVCVCLLVRAVCPENGRTDRHAVRDLQSDMPKDRVLEGGRHPHGKRHFWGGVCAIEDHYNMEMCSNGWTLHSHDIPMESSWP